MAVFVGAGALAGNATVTPQAISSHASTAVGDILFCQLINKSATANVVTPPDATWTKVIEASNSAAVGPHQYTLFWKRASLAGAQSYTFTKATDDNVLFAGVISTWRASGLDPTTRGVTATTGPADNVSFPAFDPVGVAHVIYFAWYGLSATTFGTMAGTNPTCSNRYDLESATGTTCTLAATSGDSDPSSIASRTWASASTTDAGSTGVVIAISDAPVAPAPSPPLFRRMVAQAGGVSGPVVLPSSGSNDVRFSSTRTKLDVRQTLIYRPLTVPPRQGPVTDTVPVTQATVTFTGKTVTGIDTGVDVNPVASAAVVFTGKTVTLIDISADVTPVTQAAVTYTGQTVSIGDATPPGNNDVLFASTTTTLRVRRSLIYRPLTSTIGPLGPSPGSGDVLFATTRTTRVARRALLYRSLTAPPLRVVSADTTTVTQATVTVTGKTITVRDAEVTPVLKASVTVTGKTVTVRDADVTPVAKATVTVIGKPLTEFGLIPVNKATVVFAGQTVALVDPGVDRVIVDKADVLFTGKTVTLVEREVIPVLKGSVLFTGQTVFVRDLEITPTLKSTVTFTGKTVTVFDAAEIIPVNPGAIRFIGQEVTLTGQGETKPPTGGGGVTVPPWIDYGRKHRRRYRALEEIEKRLDERIKRLETEKAELDGSQGQQVGVQLAAPDLARFLLNFEQLLNRQAAINAALLEAQRRAELVRQERIQLAILAQRAAEAIDEEEAITMLLLT